MEKNEAYAFGSAFDPVPAPFSAPPPMGRTGTQSVFIPSSFRVPPQPNNNYRTTTNTFEAPLLLPVATTTAYGGSGRVTELVGNDLGLIGSGGSLIGGTNENGDGQIRKRRNVALQKPRSSFESFSFPASGSYMPHVPSPFPARAIDRTRLTFLFEKELQKSDVSRLQRIVLPKKSAEFYLPVLEDNNGFVITMDDMDGASWKFKFRYWFNNKSRMYVLENTGAFVKKHGLQTGDSILLHRECLSNNYVIEARKQSFTKYVNISEPKNVSQAAPAAHVAAPVAAPAAPVAAPAAFGAGGTENAFCATEDHLYIDNAETNFKEPQLIYDLKVYNPNLDDTSMSFNYNQWWS